MAQDNDLVIAELTEAIIHLENAQESAATGTSLMLDDLIEDADELRDRTVRLYQGT